MQQQHIPHLDLCGGCSAGFVASQEPLCSRELHSKDDQWWCHQSQWSVAFLVWKFSPLLGGEVGELYISSHFHPIDHSRSCKHDSTFPDLAPPSSHCEIPALVEDARLNSGHHVQAPIITFAPWHPGVVCLEKMHPKLFLRWDQGCSSRPMVIAPCDPPFQDCLYMHYS